MFCKCFVLIRHLTTTIIEVMQAGKKFKVSIPNQGGDQSPLILP